MTFITLSVPMWNLKDEGPTFITITTGDELHYYVVMGRPSETEQGWVHDIRPAVDSDLPQEEEQKDVLP